MPYLGVLDSNFIKLLSYLKSAPSNWSNCKVCLIAKFHEKMKTPEFEMKTTLFGLFLG